jgi:hypothetical protein
MSHGLYPDPVCLEKDCEKVSLPQTPLLVSEFNKYIQVQKYSQVN